MSFSKRIYIDNVLLKKTSENKNSQKINFESYFISSNHILIYMVLMLEFHNDTWTYKEMSFVYQDMNA